jgi:ATP-dependent RNA helicase DeaD
MEKFRNYGLSEEILTAIGELGFESPTPIQEKTIPAILSSEQDIIGLAQTGTGKTAGFGLPIVERTNIAVKQIQTLILCPTRELCLQITDDINRFSKYKKGLSILAVYGGASIVPQIKSLRDGAHIVVGTPGRTLDLLKRRILKLENIKWLVLDEADEMLNMGFREDLDEILAVTPNGRQTLLFSATMPDGVRRIAKNYMNDPIEISTGKKNTGAINVEHLYYVVKAANRYLALKRLADINPSIYGIVFCRTRAETKDVADKLIQDGYNADALHGDLSQAQRDNVMQRFRIGHLQLLIATDVAARGIDVQDLTHIINYNLPDDPEVYIHRSGRTGRAGKSGICMTISHSREGRRIKELERIVGKKFTLHQVPGGKEIVEKRLLSVIDKIEKVVVDEELIEKFLPTIYKKLEYLDRETLIKHFVSVEFTRFLEYYENAPDLNMMSDDGGRDGRGGRGGRIKYTRFYINAGSKNDLTASNLIGLINESIKNRNADIGKIDIQRNFSFFEIESEYDQQLLKSLSGEIYNNVTLQVQISEADKSDSRGSSDNYRKRSGSGGDRGRSRGDSRGGSSYSRGGSRDSRGGSRDSRGGSKDSRGGSKDSRGGSKDSRGGSWGSKGGDSSKGSSKDSRGGYSKSKTRDDKGDSRGGNRESGSVIKRRDPGSGKRPRKTEW